MSLSFPQGNYKGYYNRRGTDTRVDTFKADWFTGKYCIDIGCNEGQLTLDIAQRYQPKSIIGIDYDGTLIESAQSKLKRAKYTLENEDVQKSKTSDQVTTGNPSIIRFRPRNVKTRVDDIKDSQLQSYALYPYNLQFARRDISCFNDTDANACRYDTILCLSVTKWIHLNQGDEGLLQLFNHFFHILRTSGRLILEYQTWKSYEKRKNATDTIIRIFPTIKILPEMFENVLVEKIGFNIEERMGATIENSQGFHRPILVLMKTHERVVSEERVMTTNSIHHEEKVNLVTQRKRKLSNF